MERDCGLLQRPWGGSGKWKWRGQLPACQLESLETHKLAQYREPELRTALSLLRSSLISFPWKNLSPPNKTQHNKNKTQTQTVETTLVRLILDLVKPKEMKVRHLIEIRGRGGGIRRELSKMSAFFTFLIVKVQFSPNFVM